MTRARELADLLTGGQTITTADNTTQLKLSSTDADANAGPVLELVRDSGSPADSDLLGTINFIADDDAGNASTFASVSTQIGDASNGTESCALQIKAMSGGSLVSKADFLVAETVFNNGSVDLDFRVESDNLDDALFVQGSDGIVGVGIKTPAVASGYGMQIHNDSSAQTRLVMTNSDTGSAGTDGFQIVVHTDTGAILELRESADLRFATGATERMRLASDGDLLIGKASDTFATDGTALKSTGEVNFTRTDAVPISLRRSGTAGNLIEFYHDSTTVGKIGIQSSGFFIDGESGHEGIRFANGAITPRENGSDSDATSDLGASNNRFKDGFFSNGILAQYHYNLDDPDTYINFPGSDVMQFFTGGSQRAEFNTGALRIGQSTTDHPGSGNTTAGIGLRTTGDAFFSDVDSDAIYGNRNNAGGVVSIALSGVAKGGISVSSSAVAFNTTSDRRLKSNIQDAASASDKIDALQVRQFDWNVDGSHQDFGLVAQELQPIAPTAVLGNADSDEMMSVDYSKLVPMLIKEIQELRSRVATLEAS